MKYSFWESTGRVQLKRGRRYLEVVCTCGTSRFVKEEYLEKGASKSCGCKRGEMVSAARLKHGHSGQGKAASRTYNSWRGMIVRCTKPNHLAYKNYGGRGITVCQRWLKFENFLADMGERPAETVLDRTDNEGGYTPENCQWVTRTQSIQNTRVAKTWFILGGEHPSARAAAAALGVTKQTIMRWCSGYNASTKTHGKPKPNCYRK